MLLDGWRYRVLKHGKARASWSAGSVRGKAAPHIGIAAYSTQSGAASSCHVLPSEKRHITQWEVLFLTLGLNIWNSIFGLPGTRVLGLDIWNPIFGIWDVGLDMWNLGLETWYLELDSQTMASGLIIQHMGFGTRYLEFGFQDSISGTRYLAYLELDIRHMGCRTQCLELGCWDLISGTWQWDLTYNFVHHVLDLDFFDYSPLPLFNLSSMSVYIFTSSIFSWMPSFCSSFNSTRCSLIYLSLTRDGTDVWSTCLGSTKPSSSTPH